MSVLTLPKRSRAAILAAVAAIAALATALCVTDPPHPLVAAAALIASAFVADAMTACFHFGFDYVFPYDFPVLGPISREFNEHHDFPTLDPGNLVENLSKGAYASLGVSLLALLARLAWPAGLGASFVEATLILLALWTLFFHQMHSYAHMGSVLPAEVFHRTIAEIAQLSDRREQKRRLRALFRTVPIPPGIRLLQRLGLSLEPGRHNLHHIAFERDFSSVNGWSDPFLNPLFTPWARRLKARRAGRQAAYERLAASAAPALAEPGAPSAYVRR